MARSALSDPGRGALRITLLVRSLNVGGAERQAAITARELRRLGHDVTMCVMYSGGHFETLVTDAGVPLIRLDRTSRWDILGPITRLIRHLRRSRTAVLYSYTPGPNIAAAVAKPFCPGLALIWGIRASNVDLVRYGRMARLSFALGRILAVAVDHIIANSESGRRHHVLHGYPATRMSVIANGIDTDTFKPDADAGRRLRAEWGVEVDAPLVGIAARLDPMKDHETFLHAAALLHARRPEVRFVAIGEGEPGYVATLKARAQELLPGAILHWAGRRDDMPAVYNALTVSTSTSAFGEGFSNAIAEAMASGTPVVVTDVGDGAAMVGDTGFVVECRRPEALADAWARMLASDRATMGARARARIEQHYSPAAMARQTIDVAAALVPTRSADVRATTSGPTDGGAASSITVAASQ